MEWTITNCQRCNGTDYEERKSTTDMGTEEVYQVCTNKSCCNVIDFKTLSK